jgi:hypothetical protein
MSHAANAKVIPLQKDPATLSDRELFDYIQYLKRDVAQRADERARLVPGTVTEEVRQSLERIAASDREQLAILQPIEEELRRIFDL